MFRLYCWICVTWQSYPALLPSSHSDSYHSCQTSLCGEILPNRSRHHCGYVREHFPVPLSHPQTKKKKVVVMKAQSRGVKPRSFVSMFTSCCWGFRLVWGLFTRSDKWQPETGKELCVIAVKGTDQISHSLLSCHRSAKIKGENSPALCHNLFFPHTEVPCVTS